MLTRLVTTLRGYGIHGKLPDWIKDFLLDRTQYVNVGGECSEEVAVTSGVPQGSGLSPTLFIYFINDMPEILKCLVKIFADDTKVYTAAQSEEHCRLMQNRTDQLVQWTKDWQIKFKSGKCKILHVGKYNPGLKYFMYGRELQCTEVEKDLGLFIDKDLKFEQHMNENSRHDRTLHSNKHKEIMVPLFKSLVRPILEYGNAVWAHCLINNITRIENRRFTKTYYWHEQPGV